MGVRRRVSLDVLMACFGIATWLGVNGIFVQLPLLVDQLPEGWALPSFISIVVAAANIGLPVYALLKRLFPRVSDSAYIYGLLFIGMVALLLMAFLYTETVVIAGEERSVAFISLTFFTGLVGCTSSVLFYPYLRHFREIYLMTYLVGEGLSNFVPSVISLIQGVGGEPECVLSDDGSTLIPVFEPPRFSVMVFILLLAFLSMVSLLGFTAIDRSSSFASERVTPNEKADEAKAHEPLLRLNWMGVMVLMTVLNGIMNGILPSVQSYSCMPYGTRAYHLAASLATMANPLACMAGVWFKPISSGMLNTVLVVSTVPFGYIMTTALLSPTPPLVGTVGGEFLVVSCWVWVYFVLSYGRMWIYDWARQGGARGMRAIGTAAQLGSSSFAVLIFLLVNFTDLFIQAERCPPLLSM